MSTIDITFVEVPTVDVSTVISGTTVAAAVDIDYVEPTGTTFDVSKTASVLLEGVFLDGESYAEYSAAFKAAYIIDNPG